MPMLSPDANQSNGYMLRGSCDTALYLHFDRRGARPVLEIQWTQGDRPPGLVIRLSQYEAESVVRVVDGQFPGEHWRRDARARLIIDDGHSVLSFQRDMDMLHVAYQVPPSSRLDTYLLPDVARCMASMIRDGLLANFSDGRHA